MPNTKVVCSSLLICLLAAAAAFGQITGEVRGVVLDPSGAAVPPAKVTLKSVETGATREQQAIATRARQLLAAYRDTRDLIEIGAYRPGANPLVDEAIALRPMLNEFCKQAVDEASPAGIAGTDTRPCRTMRMPRGCRPAECLPARPPCPPTPRRPTSLRGVPSSGRRGRAHGRFGSPRQ